MYNKWKNNRKTMVKFIFENNEIDFNQEKNEILANDELMRMMETNSDLSARFHKELRKYYKSDKIKLNIGSGFRPKIDFINLDYDEKTYPDIIRNIDEGLPFDSDKFDEIYTSHVIEHVKDIFLFIYEMWRVTKNKGTITIICPNGHNVFASIQPDHLRQISYSYFDRWRPEHRSVQNELKQTRGAFFNIIKRELFNEEREIKFILEVVK
jgi:predicted SAM-dependent methyltransferase